jgi:hypothetical protein
MQLSRAGLRNIILAASLLAVAGCASRAEPEYATKADLQALRNELLGEIRASQAASQAASEQAAAAAAAAQQAAADAAAAAEKADAIFRQSLRK